MSRAIEEFEDTEEVDGFFVICPWCKHKHDAYEWSDGDHECYRCEKTFTLEVVHSVDYHTTRVTG